MPPSVIRIFLFPYSRVCAAGEGEGEGPLGFDIPDAMVEEADRVLLHGISGRFIVHDDVKRIRPILDKLESIWRQYRIQVGGRMLLEAWVYDHDNRLQGSESYQVEVNRPAALALAPVPAAQRRDVARTYSIFWQDV
jgi:hypothetical protein